MRQFSSYLNSTLLKLDRRNLFCKLFPDSLVCVRCSIFGHACGHGVLVGSGDARTDFGKFLLDTRREYRRLEEKIFFLIRKFSKSDDHDCKRTSLWHEFEGLKDVRNKIAHPK